MIIANWKMNMTTKEAKLFFQQFHPKKQTIICAPFTLLPILHELKNPNIKIGAQNLFYENKGAYTGEISAAMIKEFAEYVIIGHSERRKIFNEFEEMIEKKIAAAVSHGLIPIVCISNINQLSSLSNIYSETLYIAYEPVESIGTGNAAHPEAVNSILAKVRSIAEKNAKNLFLLYGGSVTSNNAQSFLEQKEINGLLVGGASLNPEEYTKLIQGQ